MKKYILSMLIFLLSFLAINENAFGSGASAWLKGESVVTVGDEFDITLEVSSEEKLSEIETYLSYTDETAKFISADDGIAGGKGLLRVNIRSFEDDSKKFRYKIKFLAHKAGKFTISFSDTVHLYAEDTDDEVSVASSDLELLIKNKREASSDSTLANLKVAGVKLNPAFSKSVLDYNVEVGKDVDDIVVGVDTSDANSEYTYSKDYEDKLKTGENKIKIVVKAEDGSTTTYTITVFKLGEADGKIAEQTENVSEDAINGSNSGKNVTSKSAIKEEPEYVPDPPEDGSSSEKNIKDGKKPIIYVIISATVVLCIMIMLGIILYIKNKRNSEFEE